MITIFISIATIIIVIAILTFITNTTIIAIIIIIIIIITIVIIIYSTLNKITQFWLVESSTINPKLYSVGVPFKFLWKRSVRTIISGK